MIHLKKGREKSLKRRHPWIFSGSVERISGKPNGGETVEVRDASGKPLALAAYSPSSQIRARVWSFDVAQAIDETFFRKRLEHSISMRNQLPAAKHSNAPQVSVTTMLNPPPRGVGILCELRAFGRSTSRFMPG